MSTSAASGGGGSTVTWKVTGSDGLPLASSALHVTVVVPSGKNEPEAGAHVIAGALSKLSLAVTSKSTTAPGRLRSALSSSPPPAVTSTSSTGATTGAVQSATNAADVSPLFPSASWAVTVSVCAPSAGGVNWKLASHATGAPSTAHVNVPGSLSATVAVAVWSAPLPGVIEIVAVGAVVSTVNPVCRRR